MGTCGASKSAGNRRNLFWIRAWLSDFGEGSREQGFALAWTLPGIRDNSRVGCHDNSYPEDGNN